MSIEKDPVIHGILIDLTNMFQSRHMVFPELPLDSPGFPGIMGYEYCRSKNRRAGLREIKAERLHIQILHEEKIAMKTHFYRTLALITSLVMVILALCAGTASAGEESAGILGKPFPDFTVTDTEGNSFTLSEALKDHEAVLINFWATWCGPCQSEFPYLNEAYGKYSGRVSFIALSTDKKDTPEKIESYRKENGIAFPMGRDEGDKLGEYVDTSGIPRTVIVDRFGNAVYFHEGAFSSAGALERVLDVFLGDSYTETSVLDRVPRDTSTHAYPVSAARAIYPESGKYRKVIMYYSNVPTPITGYIIPDDSVRLRIEISAEDDVINMTYMDMYQFESVDVLDLLDPERGVYVYDQEMPGPSDERQYVIVAMSESESNDTDDREINVILFKNEEGLLQAIDEAKADGLEIRWQFMDSEEKAENVPQAYIFHVLDQDDNPVGEVTVNFCTDTACVPQESDGNGLITFTGAPDAYHVQIIDVPDGYSWDEDYEMYTPRKYGEWVLHVRKD